MSRPQILCNIISRRAFLGRCEVAETLQSASPNGGLDTERCNSPSPRGIQPKLPLDLSCFINLPLSTTHCASIMSLLHFSPCPQYEIHRRAAFNEGQASTCRISSFPIRQQVAAPICTIVTQRPYTSMVQAAGYLTRRRPLRMRLS